MVTLEEKLQKRKIDALRRGIHRVGEEASLPFSVNLVGVGKAGTTVVATALKLLPPSDKKLSALIIDVDAPEPECVREAAARHAPGSVNVEYVSIEPSNINSLRDTLSHYKDFLALEYPFFPWHQSNIDWLPASAETSDFGADMPRAYAKALYGQAYYGGERPVAKALRRFGERLEDVRAQPIVCVIFDVSDPVSSGITVDLTRHLSNVVLGRRALVVGIGIFPCSGDDLAQRGGAIFATLNELDCLGDESKNEGVVSSCGQLFRNPFTAGLLLVPQEPCYRASGDLVETRRRVANEIASLVVGQNGSTLWELLRMLNWVAAPSTQHSAARTPWGAKWIHVFGFADLNGSLKIGSGFREAFGIDDRYTPEFLEFRVPRTDGTEVEGVAEALQNTFSPDVSPQIAGGGREGSVQFVLPSISKMDLKLFSEARAAYDREDEEQRTLDHSLLLEQGLVLSEPSTRLAGMAGASREGADSWIAVPLQELLGAPVSTNDKAAVAE